MSAAEQTLNKYIGPAGKVNGGIWSAQPRFHENDPVNRAAHELVNRFSLDRTIPVTVDDKAEIAPLTELILDASNDDWGEDTRNAVGNDSNRECPVRSKAPRDSVWTVTPFSCKTDDSTPRVLVNSVIAVIERTGHC